MAVVRVSQVWWDGDIVVCQSCKRYRPVRIMADGLCSYCRREAGLMPDQQKSREEN